MQFTTEHHRPENGNVNPTEQLEFNGIAAAEIPESPPLRLDFVMDWQRQKVVVLLTTTAQHAGGMAVFRALVAQVLVDFAAWLNRLEAKLKDWNKKRAAAQVDPNIKVAELNNRTLVVLILALMFVFTIWLCKIPVGMPELITVICVLTGSYSLATFFGGKWH